MATAIVFGPADHGRLVTREEFGEAQFREGFRYEVIDGRLYVAAMPNPPHGVLQEWLHEALILYKRAHPEVINFVASAVGVPVAARERLTVPAPDLAAFHDFPRQEDWENTRWDDVSPVLVIEVVSENDPGKDLTRNVELYLEVPSIREYWVIDPRPNPREPTLTVYRRRGARWQRPIVVPFGETYTTRLLPGFELVIDPNRG
jgi:Uma2 family endonuclease